MMVFLLVFLVAPLLARVVSTVDIVIATFSCVSGSSRDLSLGREVPPTPIGFSG